MTLIFTNSNMKNALQSWKSPSDPSIGRFSIGTDSLIHPQVIIWDGDKKYWRSGPWNGNLFLGLVYADPSNNYADASIQNLSPEEAHFVYTGIKTLEFSHYVFDYNGKINENYWDKFGKGWKTVYRAPDVECDVYGTCGVFGSCNPKKSPICRCLKGFSPLNSEEWSNGNWSRGCVRNNPLLCGDEAGKDGFLMLSTVKLPDFAIWLKGVNPSDCRKQCLENCSCLGYTYDNGAGCLYWNTDLIDIQELKMSGVSLYLRLSHFDLVGNRTKIKGIIAAAIISNAAFIALFIFFLRKYLKCRKDKANKKMLEKQRMRENRSGPVELELKELPYYEFQDLLVATNNFHEKNKLGHGGFGQVYKGKMEDGQEIAVKRLSTAHGQGSEEFVNEVVVISGLQHMNLVRLLGFCTQGEEKILVYEYMANRSLDAFLFDPTKQEVLNWDKRFNIIEGICRGLVYLHRDSRVRIIHRDLKASNILLDKDLNAKISDFGMARIFGRYQDQEETRRIVGTFGYMAPEYTLEGNFSEKSDVYSFGVLMLEIVTGKRNNAFWCEDQSLTLLGYVWNFWVDGNVGPVLDPVISHPIFRTEIEKCIQIGLLCVQEFVRDRPTMSTVVTMLGSDNADLPIPKKPGFTQRLTASDSDSIQMLQSSSSMNQMSFTGVIAR
ncbi:G-type lectin S-receptor-like serine/threonine-protein kinase SD1-13 [Amaranthus tricolor]|uniref:G-type lectin S-receptor-like serine/threonine-protein kinase SD1-13 n=1 Tax=Amaranthus tricolor TaxID=29722 RepID=UPI002588AFC6|nr:G-type lectin S-receptor-like serine/threonine-protein kinase SD1-13 [Amaranthus tricolor]